MERYEGMMEVGRGSFGVVWKAFDKQTREFVAVKKLVHRHERRNQNLILREIKALNNTDNHPNIVKLKEVVVEYDTVFMVFEYMECSLHMHRNGYFHRDLKPDNLLVSKDVIKIADLGSARKMDSRFPYTDYITTRWYRAPEVLLGSTGYEEYVDMWAMGAIMAELFTFRPLFRGSSTQDMIYKICMVLGTPTESTWSDGVRLAREINIRFPECIGVEFSRLFPYASPDAVNLISSLLSWHPWTRPRALEALQHPFFNKCNHVARLKWHNPGDIATAIKSGKTVFKEAKERELLKRRRTYLRS